MKQITVAICGLGGRGKDTYAKFQHLHPEMMKIVAVADPDAMKVSAVSAEYGVPAEGCFASCEALLEQPRLADVIIVATQDRQHVGHAIPALEKGYHVLLEKPVSPDMAECLALQKKAHERGRVVVVCHVLRYTPFFSQLKKLIADGRVGEVMSIQMIENVGYWHQAHSFVRGNWRRSDETSPMILAKCCHDMDILQWLVDKPCVRLSSYGGRGYFHAGKAPKGSTSYCLGGCQAKESCPYDAEKIYVTDEGSGVRGSNGNMWPANVVVQDPTEEKVYAALRAGPYGRCVFHCDNDVVDHQVMGLEFDGGATASFTMCGFTSAMSRQVKVMGTLGDIEGNIDEHRLTVTAFGAAPEVIDTSKNATDLSGHHGGDTKMLEEFLTLFQHGDDVPGTLLTSLDNSLQSHYMAMAAEYSRLHGGGSVVLEDFVSQKL